MIPLQKRIASDLGISEEFILQTAKNANKAYKIYTIGKPHGGQRRIYHPSAALKTLQYWLTRNVFSKFPVSDCATAYMTGCSIKNNASRHINQRHLLHMDIRNFFESITSSHVESLFLRNTSIVATLGLTDPDIKLIQEICLLRGRLTIGSVCAPIISNCIMYEFDVRLRGQLPDYLVYTRYADDLVFSSPNYIDANLVTVVKELLHTSGFQANNSKTKFMSPAQRQKVTGIIINDNRISIGFQRRQAIKKMLYRKLKYNEGSSSVILGYLNFAKDVEPHFYNRIIIKYSHFGDVISKLRSDIEGESHVRKAAQLEAAASIEQ